MQRSAHGAARGGGGGGGGAPAPHSKPSLWMARTSASIAWRSAAARARPRVSVGHAPHNTNAQRSRRARARRACSPCSARIMAAARGAPVVSSQGLTSSTIMLLVSLALAAPRALASSMIFFFFSASACSSCARRGGSQGQARPGLGGCLSGLQAPGRRHQAEAQGGGGERATLPLPQHTWRTAGGARSGA